MNTITKTVILEADRLATLYAGELRGKGFTPKTSPAVTSEKTFRCEFQNGELNKITLPIGRLADWARTFKGDETFDVEWAGGKLTLCRGASRVTFANQSASLGEKELSSLDQVPPLRFDDAAGSRRDFQLIAPPETGNLAATLKSRAAAQKLAKLRDKEIAAKSALKLATKEHCEKLYIVRGDSLIQYCEPTRQSIAYQSAVTRARHLVRSFRMLRRAIAAPQDIIPWLGETITPRGEYDASDVKNFTPEHWDCVAAVFSARAECQEFAKKRPGNVGGPKHQALQGKVSAALAALLQYIVKAWREEMTKNGLPDVFVYMANGKPEISQYSGDLRAYSRARIAVRAFPVKKYGLAQTYIETMTARRAFESKAIADGKLISAKATHADGTVKTGVVTPEKYAELESVAAEKGAKLEVVFAAGHAAEAVAVKLEPLAVKLARAESANAPDYQYIAAITAMLARDAMPVFAGENI